MPEKKKYRRRSFFLRKREGTQTEEELEIMYDRDQPDCRERLILRFGPYLALSKPTLGICLTDEDKAKLRKALE